MDDYRSLLWDLAWKVKRAAELRSAGAGNKGQGSAVELRAVNHEISAIVEKVTSDPSAFGPALPELAGAQGAGQLDQLDQLDHSHERGKRGGQHDSAGIGDTESPGSGAHGRSGEAEGHHPKTGRSGRKGRA